jgi:ABC-type metal ion transport system substrate-binding protein
LVKKTGKGIEDLTTFLRNTDPESRVLQLLVRKSLINLQSNISFLETMDVIIKKVIALKNYSKDL